ncbi:hypothetical protein CUJ83_07160 [Methanocella sp. CWC-04]|uniref:Uncharacterized protein n=1 Tax=Methanooceanicella nereidis TaxID=2052831 RepID=A0AAP2W766_9EURY|nr:hypothetical protein [Methanocella sp. CWC-04]MCD1294776.1 hypothetical protein [Methanocella sp. CWC-04]
MKFNKWTIVILLISIFFLVYIMEYCQTNTNNIINDNLSYIPIDDLQPVASPSSNNSSYAFCIPDNDYVINNIKWSSYPNLEKGYILVADVVGPNQVLNYKFIDVQLLTEVKNTDNEAEIYDQLCCVAREARKIYGPDGGINIYGTKGGVEHYHVEILPHDNIIYCRGWESQIL